MNDAFWSFEASPSLLLFLQNYNSKKSLQSFNIWCPNVNRNHRMYDLEGQGWKVLASIEFFVQ